MDPRSKLNQKVGDALAFMHLCIELNLDYTGRGNSERENVIRLAVPNDFARARSRLYVLRCVVSPSLSHVVPSEFG